MNGWLIRVGIDSGNMGYCAPVFPEGTFEYIPLPAFWPTEETRTYGTIEARNKEYGKYLSDFMHTDPRILYDNHGDLIVSSIDQKNEPLLARDIAPHYDPEFETNTFGDSWKSEGGRIPDNLEPRDYLFFYSGLAKYDSDFYLSKRQWNSYHRFQFHNKCPHIIGYLRIREIIPVETEQDLRSKSEIANNAHAKENIVDCVVLKGDESKLLTKAIQLYYWDVNTGKYSPTEIGKMMGLQPVRGVRVWKWLDEADCKAFLEITREYQ